MQLDQRTAAIMPLTLYRHGVHTKLIQKSGHNQGSTVRHFAIASRTEGKLCVMGSLKGGTNDQV